MSGRIMVADGLATNRILVKAALSAGSFQFQEAGSAAEVISTVLRKRPDVLLLDWDLPPAGAPQLCQDIRSNPDLRDIPIIVLSATFCCDERLAALAAGATEVLPKPASEQCLRATVRNALRMASLEKERRDRAATAAELGFAENPAQFVQASDITVVGGLPAAWMRGLAALGGVRTRSAENAVDLLREWNSDGKPPDLVVLGPDACARNGALNLTAELRSRERTRNAGIIVVHTVANRDNCSQALDIGASEVLGEDSLADEFLHRVSRQLDLVARSRQLRTTLEESMHLAVTDPLTGLFNRRYAIPHLKRMAAKAARPGQERPFAVLVLDLDRFKAVNDAFGHAAGDDVLKGVAQRLIDNTRCVDLVARMGGEEFLIAMPDTTLIEAQSAAERLRQVIEAKPVQPSGGDPIPVTVSIGIAVSPTRGDGPDHRADIDELVEAADVALRHAKSNGRNLVWLGRAA